MPAEAAGRTSPCGSRSCYARQRGNEILIVDTGPLFADADADDAWHDDCVDLLERAEGPLVVPILVVSEASYFIEERLGPAAQAAFLADIVEGRLRIEPVEAEDWPRILELVVDYADLPLGAVDASIVAAAERLGATQVATLDRRDFSVVRPSHVGAFTLVP